MNTTNVAAAIIFVRDKSGMTQSELALRAGTSQSAVARYESGQAVPYTSTLQRIARAGGYEVQLTLVPARPSDLSGSRARKLRDRRSEITHILLGAGATNPRIFGSVSRGEDTDESDIDLLVDFDLDKGLLPILHLNEALSRLMGERVEVSPVGALRENVLREALAEAVPL